MCATASSVQTTTWSSAPSSPPTTSRPRHELRQRRGVDLVDPRRRVSRVRTRRAGEVVVTTAGWMQFAFVVVLLACSTPLLGRYMAKVYGEEKKAPGDRFFLPVERFIYRVCGVDPESEQRWTTYALSLLGFSLASLLVLYLQLRIQGHL